MKKLFLLIIAIFIGVFNYYYTKFDNDLDPIINYKPSQTTQIFDKNGVKIANAFDDENRNYVSYADVPPPLIKALLAIEDTTFFEHHGVDFSAILRAAFNDLLAAKVVEGGSTLTQQLIKNTLLTREKKLSRKVKELVYAMILEHELTKEQILERYLNEIYLGHGYYGFKTASKGYFHKELKDLSIKEMAILAGLPKAPSLYSPTKNYEISLERANHVLERMHSLGWIDDKSYEAEIKEQPKVYDTTLTQNLAPYIADEVVRELSQSYPDIRTGGYKIYTTIDLNTQQYAHNALLYAYDLTLKRVGDANDTNLSQLNGAIVSMDSKTGEILALVGGVDYAQSSFNRATQTKRQPGSAFKPFLYQVALNLGYFPTSMLQDIAKTFKYEKDGKVMQWRPKNYEKGYAGLISMREALVHSKNLATINMVADIGLDTMIYSLEDFGIKNLPHYLSLALGTISLSPLELTKYYSSFANNGVQVTPFLIKKIEKDSENLYTQKTIRRPITTPDSTYLLTTILQDVIKRGTGKAAAVEGIELAGKTGTTNKNIDAWFAGYSPSIETIVWFGNDDNSPMHRNETGGLTAAPAFSYFYKELLKSHPEIERKFVDPDTKTDISEGKEE